MQPRLASNPCPTSQGQDPALYCGFAAHRQDWKPHRSWPYLQSSETLCLLQVSRLAFASSGTCVQFTILWGSSVAAHWFPACPQPVFPENALWPCPAQAPACLCRRGPHFLPLPASPAVFTVTLAHVLKSAASDLGFALLSEFGYF